MREQLLRKRLKRFPEELAQGKPLEEILQGHSRARKPVTYTQMIKEKTDVQDHRVGDT